MEEITDEEFFNDIFIGVKSALLSLKHLLSVKGSLTEIRKIPTDVISSCIDTLSVLEKYYDELNT